MAASSIGAQMGIIASPVSVAVVSLVAMLSSYTFNGRHLEFLDLLSITIPSTLCGILAIGIFSWFRGKDLDKDPEFQKFISVPENHRYVYGDAATLLDRVLPRSNWIAMWIFLATIALVAVLGVFRSAAQLRRQTALHGPGDPDVHADGRGVDRHHYPHQPGVYL